MFITAAMHGIIMEDPFVAAEKTSRMAGVQQARGVPMAGAIGCQCVASVLPVGAIVPLDSVGPPCTLVVVSPILGAALLHQRPWSALSWWTLVSSYLKGVPYF